MVRAKIPITWIKSDASRHVTFTKRKKGLKKKVEELAILCGVEVCMICFGPQAGKPPSAPYSWGLPGVAHVINKYRSLSKEEQDKKKLDNTSLLEQQIKKLKSELKLKVEQNRNLENERAYFLWDDRLNGYGLDDLKQLADMVLDRTREVYEKISYVSQQQQDVLQGYGSCALDQRTGTLVADGTTGNNAGGDFEGLNSCPSNHELMISSQGPYQQLVANLNPYNNLADNPSSSNMGALLNANTQPYNHGLINHIPLLGLPAYIDDQKADISPLPLNHSAPSASSSFFLNANTMLPSSSDAPYVVNPKLKEQEQLPEPHILLNALHPTLLKTKLYELMEPHMLSNMTWRQAVGLQVDHQYGAAYAGSPSSQEMHQAAGEHNAEAAQWSGDNIVMNNEGAGRGDQETYDGSTQLVSVDNAHFGMSGINTSGQSVSVTDAHFGGASVINSAQPSILHLDIGQLAAMANESEDPATHQVKVKEGMVMWSLEEENNKMSNVYQSDMLANEGAPSLDKGLAELENDMEVTEKSNDGMKPALLKEEDAGTASDL